MKALKSLTCLLLALCIFAACAGCTKTPEPAPAPTAAQAATPAPAATDALAPAVSPNATIVFTDSAGRNVELPANLERIAPSGPMAQVVLYTLCPDKLVGLGSELSGSMLPFMDPRYKDLPVFGNFYADTLNLEAVMSAKPQVVIDIGEIKPTVNEDMQSVQDKSGIPAVFIHMEMGNMAEAYRTLGKLVGEEEQAEKLAAYVEKSLAEAADKAASIPDDKRVKVYYAQGDAGLTAMVKGTVHTDIIDIIGAINVVDVAESIRGGASDISMEQLMLWQPDAILFAPQSIYADVQSRAEWQGINAVKNGNVYEAPSLPYNWMGRPPCVNRVIGIKWLGNLLYPDVYQYDMIAEAQEFYKLFYHCDLSEEQAKELLKTSTFQ